MRRKRLKQYNWARCDWVLEKWTVRASPFRS